MNCIERTLPGCIFFAVGFWGTELIKSPSNRHWHDPKFWVLFFCILLAYIALINLATVIVRFFLKKGKR